MQLGRDLLSQSTAAVAMAILDTFPLAVSAVAELLSATARDRAIICAHCMSVGVSVQLKLA